MYWPVLTEISLVRFLKSTITFKSRPNWTVSDPYYEDISCNHTANLHWRLFAHSEWHSRKFKLMCVTTYCTDWLLFTCQAMCFLHFHVKMWHLTMYVFCVCMWVWFFWVCVWVHITLSHVKMDAYHENTKNGLAMWVHSTHEKYNMCANTSSNKHK